MMRRGDFVRPAPATIHLALDRQVSIVDLFHWWRARRRRPNRAPDGCVDASLALIGENDVNGDAPTKDDGCSSVGVTRGVEHGLGMRGGSGRNMRRGPISAPQVNFVTA